MLQVSQGAGTGHRVLQAGGPQDEKTLAATTTLPKPVESDSEGSMPPIDSGDESDLEDGSSGDESSEII